MYAGHHDLSRVGAATAAASAAAAATVTVELGVNALSCTASGSHLGLTTADYGTTDFAATDPCGLDTMLSLTVAPGRGTAVEAPPHSSATAAGAAAAVPDRDGTPLYVALPRALLCRLAHLPPLHTAREVQLGSLGAPTGCVCIGFVKVVGAGALMADVPAVATRALAAFHSLVCRWAQDCRQAGCSLCPCVHDACYAAVPYATCCYARSRAPASW